MHRVGFIATISPLAEISGPDPVNPFARAFVHGLRAQGYIDGKNLQPEMRSLEGKPEQRVEGFVADLARLGVQVVFIPSQVLVLRAQKVARDLAPGGIWQPLYPGHPGRPRSAWAST